MPTPSLFTPGALTTAVLNVKTLRRWLTRNLFMFDPQSNLHAQKQLDYGSYSETVRVYRPRKAGAPAQPVSLTRGSLKTVQFPKIYLSWSYDEKEADVIDPSLPDYSGRSTDPNQNLANKIIRELGNMRRVIYDTYEVWECLALMNGTLTLTYDDADTAVVDYGYISTGTDTKTIQTALSGDDLWTATSSHPLSQIDILCRQIRNNSGYLGNFTCLAGDNAWDALKVHGETRDMLHANNLLAGLLNLNATSDNKGNLAGVNIVNYSCWYENAAGTVVNAFDPDYVAIVPTDPGENFTREHGPCWDSPASDSAATFIIAEMFANEIQKKNPASTMYTLESRPLPLIKNPNMLRVQKVV